jgi:hypothetical protein
MDEKRKGQAPTRWQPVFGAAARCDAVRGLQIAHRTPGQAFAGYCHATDCRQLEQWTLVGILAVSVRRTRLDKQGHHQARSDGTGRAGADFLYPQRSNAQRGCVVRRHMGTATPLCRNGRRTAVFTAWRVQPMAAAKRDALPEIRTYRQGYRPEIRTCSLMHRPEIRTYTGCFWWFPMPDFRTPSRNTTLLGIYWEGFYRVKNASAVKSCPRPSNWCSRGYPQFSSMRCL